MSTDLGNQSTPNPVAENEGAQVVGTETHDLIISHLRDDTPAGL